MKKLMLNLFNKFTCILYGIALIFAVVFGMYRDHFYVNFINGLTLAGFIYLAIGLFRSSWKHGDYSIITWRNASLKAALDTSDQPSYREYREAVTEKRKDRKNPFLYAGGLIIVAAVILSMMY